MEIFLDPHTYVNLLILSVLEIVLGIDNVIFIAIICDKLPTEIRQKARVIGLSLAIVFRIGLLFTISVIASMTNPLFVISVFEVSGRDIVLLLGGVFLIYKSILELYAKINHIEENEKQKQNKNTLQTVIPQIIFIDLVLSLDSVITAVGLVNDIPVMIIAILISLGIMIMYSGMVTEFINKESSIKIIALLFLVMIGGLLLLEGFHIHVDKGVAYFSMLFAGVVEYLNIKYRANQKK